MIIDFNCSNDYILEDERVLLRPLRTEDYEHLLPFALNEPELWNYSIKSAAGEEGMKEYIQYAVKARKKSKGICIYCLRQTAATICRQHPLLRSPAAVSIPSTWLYMVWQSFPRNRAKPPLQIFAPVICI